MQFRNHLRRLIIGGVALAAVGVPSAASAAPADTVLFEEPALETCVKQQLNIDEQTAVTEADMATLDGITCRDLGLTTLEPFVFATNLKRIDVSENNISDLTPLAGITSLTTLSVNQNRVEEISALSGLTALTEVYLNNNRISSIAAFEGLPQIRALLLQNNKIADLSPLEGMSTLRILYVNGNAIHDLSPLQGIELQTLHADNQILKTFNVETGVPTVSPVIGIDGEPLELSPDPAVASASGNETTWHVDGPTSATWETKFSVGTTTNAVFTGWLPVVASTIPEVSLTGTPPNGTVGVPYSFSFDLQGKPSIPISSIIQGEIPAGLSLSPDGIISSIPQKAGAFTFKILVSNGMAEKLYSFTILITDAGPGDATTEGDSSTDGDSTSDGDNTADGDSTSDGTASAGSNGSVQGDSNSSGNGDTKGASPKDPLSQTGASAPNPWFLGSIATLLFVGTGLLLLRRKPATE